MKIYIIICISILLCGCSTKTKISSTNNKEIINPSATNNKETINPSTTNNINENLIESMFNYKIKVGNKNIKIDIKNGDFIIPKNTVVDFSANKNGKTELKIKKEDASFFEKYKITYENYLLIKQGMSYRDIYNITGVYPMFNSEEEYAKENGEIAYFTDTYEILVITFKESLSDEISIIGNINIQD